MRLPIHINLLITTKQFRNIQKLTAWVKANQREMFLVMNFYHVEHGSDPNKVRHRCGTAACLVGHGPLAGIKYKAQDGWTSYAKREFTSNDRAFAFLFSSRHSNSIKATIMRLEYFLAKGLPDGDIEDLHIKEIE